MDVVAAGVHHPDLLAEVGRADGGLEGQGRVLGHGQPVHVRPHRDRGPGLAALEHRHHPGVGEAGLRLQAEGAQPLGDQLRGLRLAVAELRVLVDALPQRDGLGREARHQRVHPRVRGRRGRRGHEGGHQRGRHAEGQGRPLTHHHASSPFRGSPPRIAWTAAAVSAKSTRSACGPASAQLRGRGVARGHRHRPHPEAPAAQHVVDRVAHDHHVRPFEARAPSGPARAPAPPRAGGSGPRGPIRRPRTGSTGSRRAARAWPARRARGSR